jgi:hypothetical protein
VVCRKLDGSIELYRNSYWSEITAKLAGESVVVRYDPERLHRSVYIYSRDGRFVGEAECRQPVGFRDVDAARTHNRLRRQNSKRYREIVRNEKTMTALQLAEQLPKSPAPEPISSKVVRMIRPQVEEPTTVQPVEEKTSHNLPARRRAMYEELRKLQPESWTEEQRLFMVGYEHYGEFGPNFGRAM